MSRKHHCPRQIRILGIVLTLPAWLVRRRTACACTITASGPIRVKGTGDPDDPFAIEF